jgi:hypothetical protein
MREDQPQLNPVADSVWIVDAGRIKVAGLPLPIRMTAIRLAGGGSAAALADRIF